MNLILFQIDFNDNLPKQVCQKCFLKLNDFFMFREQILYHDREFRRILTKSQLLPQFNAYNTDQITQYDGRGRIEGPLEDENYGNYEQQNKQSVEVIPKSFLIVYGIIYVRYLDKSNYE